MTALLVVSVTGLPGCLTLFFPGFYPVTVPVDAVIFSATHDSTSKPPVSDADRRRVKELVERYERRTSGKKAKPYQPRSPYYEE